MHQPFFYEICLQESLEGRWQVWFEGLEMTLPDGGGTILRGSLPDRAALHGILERIRDLNLTLVSVNRIYSISPDIRKEN